MEDYNEFELREKAREEIEKRKGIEPDRFEAWGYDVYADMKKASIEFGEIQRKQGYSKEGVEFVKETLLPKAVLAEEIIKNRFIWPKIANIQAYANSYISMYNMDESFKRQSLEKISRQNNSKKTFFSSFKDLLEKI